MAPNAMTEMVRIVPCAEAPAAAGDSGDVPAAMRLLCGLWRRQSATPGRCVPRQRPLWPHLLQPGGLPILPPTQLCIGQHWECALANIEHDGTHVVTHQILLFAIWIEGTHRLKAVTAGL